MATIYNTATTLDGFLATSDNSLDWLFEVPGADDAESGIGDFLAGVGAMAMGSTTYEWVLEHEALLEQPAEVAGVVRRPADVGLHATATCRSSQGADIRVHQRRRRARCTPRWSPRPATATSG